MVCNDDYSMGNYLSYYWYLKRWIVKTKEGEVRLEGGPQVRDSWLRAARRPVLNCATVVQ